MSGNVRKPARKQRKSACQVSFDPSAARGYIYTCRQKTAHEANVTSSAREQQWRVALCRTKKEAKRTALECICVQYEVKRREKERGKEDTLNEQEEDEDEEVE
jgi:hypothetical protein